MLSLPLQLAPLSRALKIWSVRSFMVGLLLLIGGCGYFQFPGVYKLYIQQGNIVTEEMVDQLQVGMTKRQVRYVMGTPLIEDTFHTDRWDYLWSLKDPRGKIEKQTFTVYFDGDNLSRFEGDYKKGPVQDAADTTVEPAPAPTGDNNAPTQTDAIPEPV